MTDGQTHEFFAPSVAETMTVRAKSDRLGHFDFFEGVNQGFKHRRH